MIPLRDNVPSSRTPVINYVLIAINVAVFLYQVSLGPQVERFILAWGLVPAEFSVTNPASWLNVFSSMFMHGGWAHVGGNLLYLWIFGDNVEDRLGHARYLFFYLACGVCAAMAQVVAGPGSPLPMVGASGAIAGVLGCYLLLYPHARVITLVPIFFFIHLTEIPAIVFLGLWFLLQLVSGAASLTAEAHAGGVAWWAHAGGFASGLLLGYVLGRRPAAPPAHPRVERPFWQRTPGGTPWAR